jgi:hypothetical protein
MRVISPIHAGVGSVKGHRLVTMNVHSLNSPLVVAACMDAGVVGLHQLDERPQCRALGCTWPHRLQRSRCVPSSYGNCKSGMLR